MSDGPNLARLCFLLDVVARDTPLFRFPVEPHASNGLARPSQVMVDKIQTVARDRPGKPIGRLDDSAMTEVNRLMVLFPGLG